MAKKKQVGNRKKPFLQIAAICEKIITDEDKVHSIIRMVDRFTIQSDKDELPPGVIGLQVILGFKAMGARGQRTLKLIANDPTGKKFRSVSQVLEFNSDEGSSGAIVKCKIELSISRVGLYWIDVFLGSDLVTKMPFELIHKKIVPAPASVQKKKKPARQKRKKR